MLGVVPSQPCFWKKIWPYIHFSTWCEKISDFLFKFPGQGCQNCILFVQRDILKKIFGTENVSFPDFEKKNFEPLKNSVWRCSQNWILNVYGNISSLLCFVRRIDNVIFFRKLSGKLSDLPTESFLQGCQNRILRDRLNFLRQTFFQWKWIFPNFEWKISDLWKEVSTWL